MRNGPYELIVAPPGFPGKLYRGKYAYEHTINYWKKHGITPGPGMQIHHKDMNHRNNKPSNLQLMTREEHAAHHGALKKVEPFEYECAHCSKKHSMPARNYRSKKKRGQKYFFCSQKCQGIFQHKIGGRLR